MTPADAVRGALRRIGAGSARTVADVLRADAFVWSATGYRWATGDRVRLVLQQLERRGEVRRVPGQQQITWRLA